MIDENDLISSFSLKLLIVETQLEAFWGDIYKLLPIKIILLTIQALYTAQQAIKVVNPFFSMFFEPPKQTLFSYNFRRSYHSVLYHFNKNSSTQ